MSNLKLVPDAPTPLEKMLLDASRAEVPSEDHKARLRNALGIGVPLSGPFAAPSPPAAPAPPPAASLPPPAVAGVGTSSLVGKVAAGVGALALAAAVWVTREPSEPNVAAPVAVAPPVTAPVVSSPRVVEASPPPQVSPLPPLEVGAATSSRQKAPAGATGADLSEQIRLIEAARAGVAARDPRSALRALDSYGSQFPRGSFGQEALVLRIRAVDQAGDFARATAMAKSFVARYPTSPHVARLKPIAERAASR